MSTTRADTIGPPTDWLRNLWPKCVCPYGWRGQGTLYGVSMGKGWTRLVTVPNCPEHDACRGFTAEVRATRPAWSKPWCPIHKTRDCPEATR